MGGKKLHLISWKVREYLGVGRWSNGKELAEKAVK